MRHLNGMILVWDLNGKKLKKTDHKLSGMEHYYTRRSRMSQIHDMGPEALENAEER